MTEEAVKDWNERAKRNGLQSVMSQRWTDAQCTEGTKVTEEVLMRVIEDSGLSWHKNVLEIGCGIGRMTPSLMRVFEPQELVCADMSCGMLERHEGDENINSLARSMGTILVRQIGKATEVDVNTKIDYVVSITVLEHIVNESEFLKSVAKLKELATDSIVLVEEVNDVERETIGYTDTDIVRTVKDYLELMSPEFTLVHLSRFECVDDPYAVMVFSRNWRTRTREGRP